MVSIGDLIICPTHLRYFTKDRLLDVKICADPILLHPFIVTLLDNMFQTSRVPNVPVERQENITIERS